MSKTIEEVSSKPVEITINTYVYYINQHILDKYFKNSSVDRANFINVDNYVVSLESSSAHKKLCDTIVLELYDSFSCNYFKNDTNFDDNWEFYFMFIYKYLKLSKTELAWIIGKLDKLTNIVKLYKEMYYCAHLGETPKKSYYDDIARSYINSLRKCPGLSNSTYHTYSSSNTSIMSKSMSCIVLWLSEKDPAFIMSQIILTQNKINVFQQLAEDKNWSRDQLMYLGINIAEYDNNEPVYHK